MNRFPSPSSSAEPPPEDEKPRRESWTTRLTRRLSPTALTALVALVSAGVALAFELWPALKPDPRDQFAAELNVVTVEREVTGPDFVREADPDPGHFNTNLREFQQNHANVTDPRGELAYVEATVHGFKRQTTTLRWTMYDAATDERITSPTLKNVSDSERTGAAPTDRSIQPIWLPPQYDMARHYFVRVELLAPDHTLLAVADSKPFRGLRPPT